MLSLGNPFHTDSSAEESLHNKKKLLRNVVILYRYSPAAHQLRDIGEGILQSNLEDTQRGNAVQSRENSKIYKTPLDA